MFKLFKLFHLFRNGRTPKHNPIMGFVKVFFFTFSFVLIAFVIIDADLLYFHWFLNDKKIEEFKNNDYQYDENGAIIGLGDTVLNPNEGSPYYGLNMMLMNKMAAGYCKDYLTIAEKHSTGESMQSMRTIKDVSGKPLRLSVAHIVGTSIAESGTWGGNGVGIPKSLIQLEAYGKSSGSLKAEEMTFYSLNHNSYQKANQADLYQPYWKEAADAPTVTTFQVHRSYFAYPSGQMSKRNGVQISMPSKMNGYGYSSTQLRSFDETDASYLPDLFSYVIEDALGLAAEYPDGVFTSEGLSLLSAILHNSGNGATSNKMVYGQSSKPVKRLGDTEEKTANAKYLNELAEIIVSGSERDNELLYNMNIYDTATWRSYLAGVMIAQGGYRVGSYCNTTSFNYLTGSQARMNALYLGLTGKWNPNVTRTAVQTEWDKYSPLNLDGKYKHGSINVSTGNCGYLYKTHSDLKITGANGAMVDACSQVNLITLAHMSSIISAKYFICKMMQYSGVDCSPNDIFSINNDMVGGGIESPGNAAGTPITAIRTWFIAAAKDVDKGAIKDPEAYYGRVYDNMSGFAKLMLANWYWYTDPANNKLQGCSYYWGGQCYMLPDTINPTSAGVPKNRGDNGNSYASFMSSCVGRSKRYGFDCAGLIRTMTSDVLPNGMLVSYNSTGTTFSIYGSLPKVYGGYYNGQNPLGIGPLFKGGYTFSSKSNFKNMPVQLQPFDILGHSGHILFFLCWIDQGSGRMLTLEATDAGQLTGLHSTSIAYSLGGNVGLIQFDHNNAYKYIMSDRRCINPANNTTEESPHTSWNSAKNMLAKNPNYKGPLENGGFLNTTYQVNHGQGMQQLNF